MKNYRWAVQCFVIVTLMFAAAISTTAQEPEKVDLFEYSLEELLNVKIKAATKTEIPVSMSPSAITVITHGQIRESGARTLPELLRLVAGANVRWNPMMQTVDLRGFGENPFTNRVLLLIDGVPYNSWNKGGFPQQPGFDFFVLQNIKQVEVIHGSGSALYGENAYWGVINIVTLSGKDLNGGKVELYGGERETRSTSVMYGQQIGDGSILLSAKYLQSQYPLEFWFDENDSKVKGADLFLKGAYKGFELSYYLHNDDVDGFNEPLVDPGLPPGASFKSADNIQQTVNILALKYDYTAKNEPFSFAGDVSFANRKGSHCAGCHAAPQDEHFKKKEPHGFQMIGDFRFGLQLPKNHVLFGTEIRRVDANEHSEELLKPEEVTEDIKIISAYTKPAFYLQDQISLVENRLHVTAGLRYDSKTNPKLFSDRFSPRLAAVFSPIDKLIVRGGWSKAFHFPDFSSLYQNTWFIFADLGTTAFPLARFQPNPGLKPEEIKNFDFGLEYRFNPKLTAKLNLFRAKVENFIVITFQTPPPPEVPALRFENHPDQAKIWGSELEVRWDFAKKVHGFANWSYQKQEQEGNLLDSSGKPFEFVYAPKHKINLGAYFGPFAGFRGGLEMAWRDKYTAPSFWYLVASGFTDPTVRPFADYAYLNLRLAYDLPFNLGQRERPLRFSVYGRNLLDETPKETLVGVNSTVAGREFFGGFEYRFGIE